MVPREICFLPLVLLLLLFLDVGYSHSLGHQNKFHREQLLRADDEGECFLLAPKVLLLRLFSW